MGLETRSIAGVLPRRLILLAVPVVVGLLFVLGSAPAARAAGCPNEAIREAQGAAAMALPECRAYELVTGTQDKNNGEPLAVPIGDQAHGEGAAATANGVLSGSAVATDGGRVAWQSQEAFAEPTAPGLDYLSSRTANGWTTENVVPPQTEWFGLGCPEYETMAGWSADLSRGVFADGLAQGAFSSQVELTYINENRECGHDEPRLAAGELEGFQNLFLRDNDSRAYQLIDITPPGVRPAPITDASQNFQFYKPAFVAGSDDLSRVIFEVELPLVPGAGSGDELYLWYQGADHLVGILPDGQPVSDVRLAASTPSATQKYALRSNGQSQAQEWIPANVAGASHAISADGTRVVFTHGGDLYLRENPEQPPVEECSSPTSACTIQVDASQVGGAGGGGEFMVASSDVSQILFTAPATSQLTADTVPGSGRNLYRYEISGNRLIDLTATAEAGVKGVGGAAEDGSAVYFVAGGILGSGLSNSAGQKPQAAEPNLYVSQQAEGIRFIATLSAERDACDWSTDDACGTCEENNCGSLSALPPGPKGLTARVSPNGRFLAFPSVESLTGFDNTDAKTGELDAEIFLYDDDTGTLSCASCGPTGARPLGSAVINYPTMSTAGTEDRNATPQRNVTDDGSVFFETPDPLANADVNGAVFDVYVYRGGKDRLLSSGTAEVDSYFLGASTSAQDVFFATPQALLSADPDQTYDIYDARIDGGFSEPGSSGACRGEECRGPVPVPLPIPQPAGSTLVGPTSSPVGSHCKPHQMKRRGRCVTKRQKVKKHRHRHRGGHHASPKTGAGHSRRPLAEGRGGGLA
jgi:hypothetical protein